MRRYLSIWFPNLVAERGIRLRPELKPLAFVVAVPQRGRMLVKAASPVALKKGINPGMVVADARAMLPELKIFHDKPGVEQKLLHTLAEWSLRFTPVVALDLPDGLLLDISGCPHLWGGEARYLADIKTKLAGLGYNVKAAIADTIGCAWGVARFGTDEIIPAGKQYEAIAALPPMALRLDPSMVEKMRRLGFYRNDSFMSMPATVLRRRFGQALLIRLDQALGQAIEPLQPVFPAVIFQQRLPCLEPVRTRAAIDMALKTLLEQLSVQLLKEHKGLRTAIFKAYRVDGQVQEMSIGTNRAVRSVPHLLKLFEQKIDTIRPGLGIELFILEAPVVDELTVEQETLWAALGDGDGNSELANLLDRIAGKVGEKAISRYLPTEHYWPERSYKTAQSIDEPAATEWRDDRPRPICLLPVPEAIKVTAPIPDYPPMLFIYQGKIHKVRKADGPERIEREWWLEQGLVRDYYVVEDEEGGRYWLFRSGHYDQHTPEWFLHGFFA
ncbi:DNA polymerase Y family protein [Niabella sp. CC-SYL272]|uniref:Y-family DNA polymerase n=1 Tax=Niabella agricola TaxID=2891571 RepID=UPI001F21FA41|nr:DNA polymerase Y family protein [Niabella agricola]MCF3109557.1 DNA polymerase Y family protein [Niabella agricola]